ncbi:hypothetical protein CK203_085675 [Vitis vinifera]|uniref:Phytocyanin domain-containing protein n=1 Tax=Vitis vinifera TaxID=29760 RepID=A0A438BLK2_VITVI|nr:hypothetical protein CK203_085675 [Vitis vinifera]
MIVFKYTAGRHNVFKVNGTVFMNCTIPPPNEALTTGNDVITLATPERKWYICGVNDHCANYGQKLAITMLEEWASPAPAPSPLHHHITSTQFYLWDLGVWVLASDGNHSCCCAFLLV